MKKNILYYINLLLIVISLIGCFAIKYIISVFGHVTTDIIVFDLNNKLQGTETSLITEGIRYCVPAMILSAVIIIGVLFFCHAKSEKVRKLREKKVFVKVYTAVAVCCFAAVLLYFDLSFAVHRYVISSLTKSAYIEENYVDPNAVAIEFPEEKRNLVYIILESMETSYASKEEGGIYNENIIPNLTGLAALGDNFCSDGIGGACQVSGTNWTVASIVGQTGGIPLKSAMPGNEYGAYEFLPGLTSIGSILEDHGYHNEMIMGSDASFANRDIYLRTHGNYELFDVSTAMTEKQLSEIVWWGFDDAHLYQYAKEELESLSREEPFNFTMLTVDTHPEGGYVCELCPDLYESQYENVVSCADAQIGQFIDWLQQQEFYERTTVVITGDHLLMAGNEKLEEPENADKRRIYTVILNAAASPAGIKDRQYSVFDLFPTTLEAMGVQIEGHKLGLGISLYAEGETEIEKYGLEKWNEELEKRSKFYEDIFLKEIPLRETYSELPSRLNFAGEDIKYYPMPGYYNDEGGYAWISGDSTAILENEEITRSGIRIHYIMPEFNVDPEKQIEISVNGKLVRQLPMDRAGECSVDILPKEFEADAMDRYEIAIKVPKTFNPHESGDSADNRDLAVQMLYIGNSELLSCLNFAEEDMNQFSMPGYYDDEGGYAWISGDSTAVLQNEEITRSGIRICYFMPEYNVDPEKQIEISVNGKPVRQLPMSREGECSVDILPKEFEADAGDCYEIAIKVPKTYNPHEAGDSADNRDLAVQMLYIGNK